jgi:demethylmenaquinone methyltransferase/2-methoxy-6-polyprenyl-1,4-benzoquinol methylase
MLSRNKQEGAGGGERTEQVRRIFSSIPKRYDFLNHLLSFRRDVAWRRFTVGRMRFFRTRRLLDVATGTGDLAVEAALEHPIIEVVGLDLVPGMLELGRAKIRKRGLEGRVRLVEGDALSLPFDDGSFDTASIAFGIRNIPDREAALREMARVVAPGGRVLVLELTTPRGALPRALYSLYLRGLLPLVGRAVSGDARAYSYLAESIMEFPSPEEFAETMRRAGLADVSATPLTLGVAHLHEGTVPERKIEA